MIKGLYSYSDLKKIEEDEEELEAVEDVLKKLIDNLFKFSENQDKLRARMKTIQKLRIRKLLRGPIVKVNPAYAAGMIKWENEMILKHKIDKKMLNFR